ncbi:DciA family protein [uncultured Pelagimonas sp.]|uniref:DUF721 domain-containing protein n=1 Tax=uncultured Pelagimonas sp. TaxID=1618102 RepID=UPI0026161EF1|nr:DciA family protein [uncultured Pelagimonas sp.]
MPKRKTTTYGFARTSNLLQNQVRKASESRGFAQSRVLTHWEEIVGEDVAGMSRPVDISYGRGGFGATLSVLTNGANAPLLQMKREEIRTRINAVYGYNAIARIRVTQTAKTGFSEGQVDFTHRKKPQKPAPSRETIAKAQEVTHEVADDSLRAALERLATNVISKSNRA